LHEAINNNPDLRAYIPSWLVQYLVGRLSNTIIVNSSFLAREFRVAGQLKPLKVVHNGVNISPFSSLLVSAEVVSVRKELGLSADMLIILAVGTANPRKGYDVLIKVAANILSKRSGVCFLIAGSELEHYSTYLHDLVIELGLEHTFRFLGARPDIPRLMKACDIFVHCARQETFGRVLIEAMVAGKPVVSTRCGGPEEIVNDGETGYLIPVDSPEVIAERVEVLLRSVQLRNDFGKAGQRRVFNCFSVESYASSIQKIILNISNCRNDL
jgi:glycosyltransferase involved in cell wall biosynthesis